jgi:hypothetical protein
MYLGIGRLRVGGLGGAAGGGAAPPSTVTWNPADKAAVLTLSESNLRVTNGNSSWGMVRGTGSANAGKRYFEVQAVSSLFGYFHCGIALASAAQNIYLGGNAGGWGLSPNGSTKWNNNVSTAYTVTAPIDGDIYSVLFDFGTGSLSFWHKGVDLGVAFSGIAAGSYFPAVSVYSTGDARGRFASTSWTYTPPAGYEQWA